MAHTVRCNLFCECDRNDLLRCRDKPARLVHDIENRSKSLLHYGQPLLIDYLVQNPVFLL